MSNTAPQPFQTPVTDSAGLLSPIWNHWLTALVRKLDTVVPVSWSGGTGSPEGVVTAPVGSLYSRSDGGAGTSFYVKESGTGNTGWVGK